MRAGALLLIAAAAACTGVRPPSGPVLPIRACRRAPGADAALAEAGARYFSSFLSAEGEPPFKGCDLVVETAESGDDLLMTKFVLLSVKAPCDGALLGGYKVHFQSDKQLRLALASGLYDYLGADPSVLQAARTRCPGAPQER